MAKPSRANQMYSPQAGRYSCLPPAGPVIDRNLVASVTTIIETVEPSQILHDYYNSMMICSIC